MPHHLPHVSPEAQGGGPPRLKLKEIPVDALIAIADAFESRACDPFLPLSKLHDENARNVYAYDLGRSDLYREIAAAVRAATNEHPSTPPGTVAP